MMLPEDIKTCTDIERLEDEQEIARGECAEYNYCDAGCICWEEKGDCILNLLTKRIWELTRE